MFNTRLFASVALCLIGSTVQAAVITEFTGGTTPALPTFIGQSATTPAGGPWNTLTFNFFSDVSGGTTPSAAGTLFLLSTAYAGAPGDLSAATPGFIAQSQGIVGNVYQFDPSVTVLGNTQYFFYTNAEVLVSGNGEGDPYPGGNVFFLNPESGTYFSNGPADANFRLSGTLAPVPEPTTLVLVSSAVLLLLVLRRTRRVVLRTAASVVLLPVLCLIGGAAQAAVITEFTGGNETAGVAFFGQSATTPAGGPWNTLTFNFFSDVSGGTAPSAAGTLFLLSTAYAGAPGDLSAATPGFIAQSQSILGNVYQFHPSVMVLGNTQYFFYTNAEVLISGETTPDLYPGGNGFLVDVDGNYTSLEWLEGHFRLSGTLAPVPEPATFVLLSSAILLLLVSRRSNIKKLLLSACVATLATRTPAAAEVLYTFQDGPGMDYTSFYTAAPVDDWWANQFDAVAGGQWITSMSAAFGHTSTPGTPVSFLLYEDVNDNGLPEDLQLLASVDTTITVINDDGGGPIHLQTVPLPVSKLVSGSFFVGVLVSNAPLQTRFLADRTNPHGRSWFASSGPGLFDPADPTSAEFPPALVETHFFQTAPTWDWVVQANGQAAAAVPEPASMTLMAGALLGALAVRRRLAAR